MAEWKLSRSEVIKLINMYKQKECLWDYKSPLYKRTDLKKHAWAEIASEFLVNTDLVKKKLKALRTSFIFEKKKVDSSKKSGASGDVYQTNLYYYDEFNFLNETVKLRESTCSAKLNDSTDEQFVWECIEETFLEESTQQSEGYMNQENVAPENKHEKKKYKSDLRQAISSKYDSAIEKVLLSSHQQPEEEDVFSSFAKSIQSQLKQLPLINATEAMAEMQNVMTKHTRQVLLSKSRVNIIADVMFKPPSQRPDSACSSRSFDSGSSITFNRSPISLTSSRQSNLSDVVGKAMADADFFDEHDNLE